MQSFGLGKHVFVAQCLQSEAGLNLVIDPTGKLLTKRKVVSRKDVIANPRVPHLHIKFCPCMRAHRHLKACRSVWFVKLAHICPQVIAAAVRGQLKSRRRQSAYIYSDAILHFVNNNKILPKGVLITAPSVQNWACRSGQAIRKLVAGFKH